MAAAWDYIKNGLLEFVGLDEEDDEKKKKEEERWRSRRMALYRTDVAPTAGGDTIDAGRRRRRKKDPRIKPKKSVMKITWKAVQNAVGMKKPKKSKPDHEKLGRSFKPAMFDKIPEISFNQYKKELFYDTEPQRELAESHMDAAGGYTPPGIFDEPDAIPMTDFTPVPPPEMRRIDRSVVDGERNKIAKHREAMITSLEDRICAICSCDCKSPDRHSDDHNYRPYFTYYITFVQIVILIVTMATYGVAFLGFDEVEETDLVLKPNLAIDVVRRAEIGNIWIGPRKADLIHLGAKYSPCMHFDPNLDRVLKLDRDEERRSGCCVRDDGSGCVQTVPEKCSRILSTFIKRNTTHPDSRTGLSSGAVCGQDPYYCTKPASKKPYEWNMKDITDWPICESTSKPGHNDTITSREDRHMTCELLGRPCCHGVQGECMITTREHCTFVRGYYHEEANLCSQVNCFEQICGMIPFYNPKIPDQFTRVFTSILLHAGVLHILVTLLFQLIIMRWVEKFIGWHRMMLIYVGSGSVGSLASAVLLPYQVEVGPSGAQFGVLACMYVDIINNIFILKARGDDSDSIGQLKIWLIIYSVILLFLFLLGLFPWMDNWAHLFGFLFGILMSLTVMRDAKNEDKGIKRIYVLVISLTLALVMFLVLLIIFYVAPLTEGSWLKYFNCVPFSDTICQDMGVSINRDSTYSKYT